MSVVSAHNVLFVLGLATSAVAFIMLVFGLNTLLSPRKPTADKTAPYECGMEQAGSPWAPVRLRFSAIAVIFVIFDAEAVLLFAVAPAIRGNLAGLIEVAAFAALLAVGLAYAWRKGALTWR
ncbi:MAG: NADH-quinone oxidoreductase subunit A [Coriobacteriia bacterium]